MTAKWISRPSLLTLVVGDITPALHIMTSIKRYFCMNEHWTVNWIISALTTYLISQWFVKYCHRIVVLRWDLTGQLGTMRFVPACTVIYCKILVLTDQQSYQRTFHLCIQLSHYLLQKLTSCVQIVHFQITNQLQSTGFSRYLKQTLLILGLLYNNIHTWQFHSQDLCHHLLLETLSLSHQILLPYLIFQYLGI